MTDIINLPARPGIVEQVAGDFSYFVATGPDAFEGADLVAPRRHKPGMCIVTVRWGGEFMTLYTKDEYLPPGAEVAP